MTLLFIGFWEMIVIVVVAIILWEPETLLNSARTIGQLYRVFQKNISDILSQLSLSDLDKHDTNSGKTKNPPAG